LALTAGDAVNGGRAGPVTGATGARLEVAVDAGLVAVVEAALPVVWWLQDVTVIISATTLSMATIRAADSRAGSNFVICISPPAPT
jgi:hypothetical protein